MPSRPVTPSAVRPIRRYSIVSPACGARPREQGLGDPAPAPYLLRMRAPHRPHGALKACETTSTSAAASPWPISSPSPRLPRRDRLAPLRRRLRRRLQRVARPRRPVPPRAAGDDADIRRHYVFTGRTATARFSASSALICIARLRAASPAKRGPRLVLAAPRQVCVCGAAGRNMTPGCRRLLRLPPAQRPGDGRGGRRRLAPRYVPSLRGPVPGVYLMLRRLLDEARNLRRRPRRRLLHVEGFRQGDGRVLQPAGGGQ